MLEGETPLQRARPPWGMRNVLGITRTARHCKTAAGIRAAPGAITRRVIYAASTRALAQVVKRVRANGVQPMEQAFPVLTLPPVAAIPYAHERGLPAHWKNDISIRQAFGDAWPDAGDELALWMPRSWSRPSKTRCRTPTTSTSSA